jgi:3-hydroxyisobutyrate dehydrogenase-like beta-hydroxyacid dehydrogenase
MASTRIGLIGVGLLGTALARRFAAAGLQVCGFDANPDRRRELASLGGEWAACASEVAASCDRLVFSLPTSDVVLRVIEEIEPKLRPGAIVMDTTTGDPQDVEAVAERLGQRHVFYLDATVGGSSRQVENGEVIVMAGGDRAAYERCQDIFAAFSRQTFYLGAAGNGSRMKLVLNLVLGLNRAVLAEGLVFASKYGLDPRQALAILKAGPTYSRVMDTKGEKMLTGNFQPEARLSQHLKDVRLILAAGEQTGARLPLSTVHRALLEAAEKAGFGGSDNSAVIKAFET